MLFWYRYLYLISCACSFTEGTVNPIFSEMEIEYLKSLRLARIVTATVPLVEKDGESIQPNVVPVGFDFDGDYF